MAGFVHALLLAHLVSGVELNEKEQQCELPPAAAADADAEHRHGVAHTDLPHVKMLGHIKSSGPMISLPPTSRNNM